MVGRIGAVTPWHKTWAKALPSSDLVDDDDVLASFISLEALSLKLLCRGVVVALSSCYICDCATFCPCARIVVVVVVVVVFLIRG
jgi:hypothetical protein